MEQTQRTWLIVAIVAIIVLVAIYIVSFGSITGTVVDRGVSDDGIIRLGFMAPLTGDAASYGQSARKGVELALKDSGLEDRVILKFEDSGCEGKGAVNAINKLISVDKVVAIIGEMCSGATLAAAPIAEQNGVVLISGASTSPEITNSGDFIFRTIPSDALQGTFGANLVYDQGAKRLGILYSNEEYGAGFNNVLEDKFRGQVVASEAFERGALDLRAQLTKIKNANPDAIYIISNSPDSAVAALTQIKELGIDVTIYGSEGLKGPEVSGLSAANGLILTSVSSGSESFMESHKTEYGTDPGQFSAQSYDAFMAIANTIKQGARTGDEIKNALYNINFRGVSGDIDFDSMGDISGNYDIFEVKSGQFVMTN